MVIRRLVGLVLVASLVAVPQARAQEGDIDPADEQFAQTERLFLAALLSDDARGPRLTAVPLEYVIVWREGVAPQTLADGVQVVSGLDAIGVQVIDLSAVTDAGGEAAANDLLAQLQANPDIEAVEPNYLYWVDFVPNDPGLSSQWAWDRIDAYEGWDVNIGSGSVVVAVIDTGIQTDHPDLDGKVVAGYDFVDDDTSAYDGQGHGTHVAGTVAAETNNSTGVAGTCPGCRLMPVRVLNNSGSGSLSDVAAGITWAADNGADVINLSLGGPSSTAMQRAVDYAWGRGVFLACAAGNSNTSARSYPAGYTNCFAVASTTSSDRRSAFSNYGTWVEVAAPGSSIYSTYPTSRYGTLSGTSMATPHVAGLAGLLASQGYTATGIRDRICATSDVITGTGSRWTCGRINVNRAVR
jgi:subtilisin family serine protease